MNEILWILMVGCVEFSAVRGTYTYTSYSVHDSSQAAINRALDERCAWGEPKILELAMAQVKKRQSFKLHKMLKPATR